MASVVVRKPDLGARIESYPCKGYTASVDGPQCGVCDFFEARALSTLAGLGTCTPSSRDSEVSFSSPTRGLLAVALGIPVSLKAEVVLHDTLAAKVKSMAMSKCAI